jgi:hypothetical protein
MLLLVLSTLEKIELTNIYSNINWSEYGFVWYWSYIGPHKDHLNTKYSNNVNLNLLFFSDQRKEKEKKEEYDASYRMIRCQLLNYQCNHQKFWFGTCQRGHF